MIAFNNDVNIIRNKNNDSNANNNNNNNNNNDNNNNNNMNMNMIGRSFEDTFKWVNITEKLNIFNQFYDWNIYLLATEYIYLLEPKADR